jgi:tetratricopeptide (TPR) repeat protein
VPAQFLGTLLHDHRPLRLAVLNACEGARASRADPFAGTAQSLVQQGIPAVIAMQFEVTDEAAICFTREFYSAIAVGYPVDAALAEARKAIFAEVSEIEWGTPVLYMRSPDGLIFEVEKVTEEDRKKLMQTTAQARIRRLEDLRKGAVAAMAAARWDDAVEKWQAVLTAVPDDQDAHKQSNEARRQQELARLYARGRSHYEMRNWKEALVEFHQLHRIARPYKDADALVAAAERELKHEAERNAPKPVVPTAPEVKPQEKIRPLKGQKSTAEIKSGRARSFVMGGVLGAVGVVGVLVVGVVIIVAIYGAINDSGLPVNTSSVSGTLVDPPAPSPIQRPANSTPAVDNRASESQQIAPAPDPVDPDEMVQATPAEMSELQRVIRAADQAEIQAYSTLNPALLQGVYTGTLLSTQVLLMNQLRQQGVVMVNTLHNITFHEASISRNGRRAQVRVTERWSTNFMNAMGQCVSHYHEHDVPQTSFLQRAGAGWVIYDVKQDSDALEMAPCH